ncbi:hypothetical protein CsatB_022425 [Cannabis sativa]
MEQIFCMLWSIWSEIRNKVVHGQRPKPARDLASYAYTYCQNFLVATTKYHPEASQAQTQPPPQVVPAPAPWKPPLGDGFKLNVDAAVDVNNNVLGVQCFNS